MLQPHDSRNSHMAPSLQGSYQSWSVSPEAGYQQVHVKVFNNHRLLDNHVTVKQLRIRGAGQAPSWQDRELRTWETDGTQVCRCRSSLSGAWARAFHATASCSRQGKNHNSSSSASGLTGVQAGRGKPRLRVAKTGTSSSQIGAMRRKNKS